jgi:hypothetical protein
MIAILLQFDLLIFEDYPTFKIFIVVLHFIKIVLNVNSQF